MHLLRFILLIIDKMLVIKKNEAQDGENPVGGSYQ